MKASWAWRSASVRRETRWRGRASRGGRPGPDPESVPGRRLRRKIEAHLLAADELDIDLGQDLGVEERSVLGALGVVDPP